MIKQATLVRDGKDLFICVDGMKVAKRGAPGTPHAGMWISLEPGLLLEQRRVSGRSQTGAEPQRAMNARPKNAMLLPK
jgi:hypothetical protein